MKRFVFSLSLLFVLLGTPPHAASQEVKLATLAKPGSPQRIVADKFKELVETGFAGRFTVAIDPNGIGGKEVEAIEGIQTNSLQMGIIAASAFEDLDPIVRVISFPFLFRNEQQAAALVDGPLGAAILRDIETIGCKGLAFSETGFRHLTNNIRPVKNLDTLSGLKIWTMSSPLDAAVWQALGANPTPKAWPIYSDLEQGGLDGQENPLWIIEAYSFFEVQKYLTLTRHSYIAHIGVASLTWWQTLNQQDQDLIQTAMVQASRYQRLDQRARERARLALFKSMGMVIDDEPDTEAFRSKTVRLKEMEIYREPRVQVLLAKMLEAVKPGETERQPTALELFDAPMPPQKPVQIIHAGKTTSDGESLPPIIEERIPPSPDPVNRPPSGSPLIPEPHQPDAPSSQK